MDQTHIRTTPRDALTAAEKLAARLSQHSSLPAAELEKLSGLELDIASIARGGDIIRQGDRPQRSVFVLSGMVGRYHQVLTGARQYISLHVAGDLPDLQSFMLGELDHALQAIDRAEIAFIPHDSLRSLVLDSPGIAAAFWRETLLDAAIFRQAVTTNGARSSLERVAHLFCELYVRAWQAGVAEGRTCAFPLSQMQVAQMLGLSIVTTNRVVQRLRRERCVEVRNRTLVIHDWSRLQKRAAFDPTYLHLDLRASGIIPPSRRPELPPP